MVRTDIKQYTGSQRTDSRIKLLANKSLPRRPRNLDGIEFDHILDNAGHGLRIIKKDFTVCQINRIFAEMSGVTNEEAVGKKCWQVFRGPFCQTPDCRLKRIIHGEEFLKDEIVRTGLDGKTIPCAVTASALHTPDDGLFGIAETFRDISDYKQLQTSIQESEERYRALIELGTKIGEAVVLLQ